MFGLRKIFILLLSLMILIAWPVVADDQIAVFIDLDGDGLNDNETDSDSDGIPDSAEKVNDFQRVKQDTGKQGILTFEAEGFDNTTSLASNSDTFSLLNKTSCVIAKSRGGFGSGGEFGPGNGIGIGAVSSGGCVGGICH